MQCDICGATKNVVVISAGPEHEPLEQVCLLCLRRNPGVFYLTDGGEVVVDRRLKPRVAEEV